MTFYSSYAEVEFLRDVLVAQSLGEQPQHLAFAVSQRLDGLLTRHSARSERRHHSLRNSRRQKSFAARDLTDGA